MAAADGQKNSVKNPVKKSITELIGNTPLVEFVHVEKEKNLKARIFGKVESFNLTGSTKDRAALYMIEDAERKGKLKPGATIVEPTSGNTGIGLSAIGRAKGYKVIIVMPETMSVERQRLMKAYGAEIVLTEGSKAISGSIAKAKELVEEIDGAFMPGSSPILPTPGLIMRRPVRKFGAIWMGLLIFSCLQWALAVLLPALAAI